MVSPLLKQSWTVSGVLLNMLGQGMVLSYPSCMLPALLAPDSPIKIDLHTASWLASSVGLASMFGFFVSSFLMEWFGRRLSHALVILPGTAGWLFIYFSTSIPTLMTGRVLGGITAGATVTLGAVVIGEYTSPEHRGMFLNLKTAAVCLGNTITHLLGHFVHWKTVGLFALVPHILAFIIVCTWPESPAWLASKRQFEKSEKAFYWLRGYSGKSRLELEDMLKAQKERLSIQINQSCCGKTKGFFRKFTRKDFVKPVIIVLFGAILLESCGRHIFPAYAPQIIGEITGNKTQSFYYTLALDLIITASATFSSGLVKVMKRRTLLFSTGLASLIVLGTVCSYLYLVALEVIPKTMTWIPLSLFVVYFILANLGCTPIPYAFLGEVFPLVHRGAGSAVSGITLSLSLMVALKVTPYLLASVSVHGTFAAFGAVMAASLLGLYFILPETKDRTLQEIEEYFNHGVFPEKRNDTEREMVKMIS
ncbi:facilitated trehalose transporter Tret1-like [Anticarsia gemmatalis]|uniref:facilitated trehalose transporter Tret1-like n=1 Tax=Anticarsia gemmatalis TaxID=129554 RepID=UPI003F760744